MPADAADSAVPFPFTSPVTVVDSVIAGVVVALATVPARPFADTTETLVTVPVPPLVAAIVIEPAPLVMLMFAPAISVALVNVLPVLLPIRSWPSVYDVCPVPPLATASVPPSVSVPLVVIGDPVKVRPVAPPDAATEVTVPPRSGGVTPKAFCRLSMLLSRLATIPSEAVSDACVAVANIASYVAKSDCVSGANTVSAWVASVAVNSDKKNLYHSRLIAPVRGSINSTRGGVRLVGLSGGSAIRL